MQSFVNCLPFVYDYFEDTYNDNTCTCIKKNLIIFWNRVLGVYRYH